MFIFKIHRVDGTHDRFEVKGIEPLEGFMYVNVDGITELYIPREQIKQVEIWRMDSKQEVLGEGI